VKSIYPLEGPVKVAVAADWASDTVQSEGIAACIRKQEADYTVHLGDTYYSGSSAETYNNFINGCWPLGKVRSFALLGNHEMYHGAYPYFDALLPTVMQQPNPFFCLENEHWRILGLDTGYQSIIGGPSNTNLKFQDELIEWLKNTVEIKEDKRGIIVLTHHQYITAFKGEDNFQQPARQLREIFGDDREIIWIWGHEHRFSIYGKYKEPDGPSGEKYVTAHGRCIGNGGMPVELTRSHAANPVKAQQYHLVLHDAHAVDQIPALLFCKIQIAGNGYAVLEINGPQLVITYYLSYTASARTTPKDTAVVKETWTADHNNGKITCQQTEDLTADPLTGNSILTYAAGGTISSIGS
jgi:predicted phosphodiesterase